MNGTDQWSRVLAGAAALLIGTGTAMAQDQVPGDVGELDDSLEVTMTLLPAGATLPDAVTRTIELPAAVPQQATDAAAAGLEIANEARERREAGLDTAADARERGREFGRDMAEQARESAGRGSESAGRPDLPSPPASLPELPVNPGTPPEITAPAGPLSR